MQVRAAGDVDPYQITTRAFRQRVPDRCAEREPDLGDAREHVFDRFRPHDANEQIAATRARLRDRLTGPDAERPRLARDDR